MNDGYYYRNFQSKIYHHGGYATYNTRDLNLRDLGTRGYMEGMSGDYCTIIATDGYNWKIFREGKVVAKLPKNYYYSSGFDHQRGWKRGWK